MSSSDAIDTPITVTAAVSEASADLVNRANVIIDELNTLYAAINGLQGEWTGSAATDYQILQNEWNIGAQGLFGADGAPGVLGEIAQAMGVVAANYYDAEEANIKTWSQ
jgi:WXG100 family type VII secretion target